MFEYSQSHNGKVNDIKVTQYKMSSVEYIVCFRLFLVTKTLVFITVKHQVIVMLINVQFCFAVRDGTWEFGPLVVAMSEVPHPQNGHQDGKDDDCHAQTKDGHKSP